MGDILSGVGSILGATRSQPKMKGAFRGPLSTSAFQLGTYSTDARGRQIYDPGALIRTGGIDPAQLMGIGNRLGGLADSIGGLRSQLNPIRGGLTGIGGDLRGLQDQVVPGFGALTQARVNSIRNQMAESVGNLRESLGRRGVLGSSFASDAQSRTEMAFGQAEGEARAQSKIEEINATSAILQQRAQNFAQQLGLTEVDANLFAQQIPALVAQAQITSQQMDRELQELAIAGNIRNGVSAVVQQQAIMSAQLDMMRQAQLGYGVSKLGGALEGMFGNQMSSWLGFGDQSVSSPGASTDLGFDQVMGSLLAA